MSDTIIAALVGALITLATSISTLYFNFRIERTKIRFEYAKRQQERLSDVYEMLMGIVNLFPREAPSDVLAEIEYPPNFAAGGFEGVLNSLNYQIGDCEKQLQNADIGDERKKEIQKRILKLGDVKGKITSIQKQYYKAKEEYRLFCGSDKAILDLYAGQDVINSIEAFEIAIHNTFVSGHCSETATEPSNNTIQISRRNIVNAIRSDLGKIF